MTTAAFKSPRILAVSDLFTSDLKRGLSCFGREDFTKRTRNFLKPVEASMEVKMWGSYLLSILFLHITIFLPILCDGGNGTFIPTNEWQTVEEGQAIPPGLHVRINLQTGRKEAKLMEKSSSNDLAKLPEDSQPADDSQPRDYLDEVHKRLQEALKNIPAEKADYSDQNWKDIRDKYRSYKDLKKEFKSVNMEIKTDTEIITGLMDEYKNATQDTGRFLRILDDLDYLVHQIDNALWFIDRGGLDTIVVPAIVNGTDINVRVKSLQLLGALIHNNPKGQIKALEKNCGNYLSHVLLSSTNNNEISAAVYAFGSLLRKFPFAQKENLPKTGTKALVGILSKEGVEVRTKVKVLTLLSDLMIEQQETLKTVNAAQDDEASRKKLDQYRNLLLDFWLHDEQYCHEVSSFVIANHADFGKEADVLEHLLQDLNTSLNLCYDVWSQSQELEKAIVFIKDLFHNISDDEFLVEISEQASLVHERLFGKLRFKDEL